MKIIIFGAGGTGLDALRYLGHSAVECFADNYKAGTILWRKKVISFDGLCEFYRLHNDTVVAVASELYYKELERQLQEKHMDRYFVFHKEDIYRMRRILPTYRLYKRPVYLSYAQILSHYPMERYSNILLYGVNTFLPYLLLEIMNRSPLASITVFAQKDYEHEFNAMGFPIVTDFAPDNIDACILNRSRGYDPIRQKIEEQEKEYDIIDLYEIDDFEPLFVHDNLSVYKDIHKGERLFVIGNGPSLRIEDLDKLHENHEICIACNKIYRIYDRTLWRADYYVFMDGKVIEDCMDDLESIPGTIFFGDTYHYDINGYMDGVTYFHYKEQAFYPNYPAFSDDFTRGFYCGYTTTYSFGLQFAAYTGAKEIILLGVDNTVKGNVTDERNHFFKDYYRDEEKEKYSTSIFRKEWVDKAYEGADRYSRQHGFRIYNATRGGQRGSV